MALEVRLELAQPRRDLRERDSQRLHGPSLVPAHRGGEQPGRRYARRMTLVLVYETHATTTDNEAGIATGWLPGLLIGSSFR